MPEYQTETTNTERVAKGRQKPDIGKQKGTETGEIEKLQTQIIKYSLTYKSTNNETNSY